MRILCTSALKAAFYKLETPEGNGKFPSQTIPPFKSKGHDMV
jgi:hypothetical protein